MTSKISFFSYNIIHIYCERATWPTLDETQPKRSHVTGRDRIMWLHYKRGSLKNILRRTHSLEYRKKCTIPNKNRVTMYPYFLSNINSSSTDPPLGETMIKTLHESVNFPQECRYLKIYLYFHKMAGENWREPSITTRE